MPQKTKERRKKTCQFCLHYNTNLKRCIKKQEKVDATKRRICNNYSLDLIRFKTFETYKKSLPPPATWGFTDEYYRQYWAEYEKQLNRGKTIDKKKIQPPVVVEEKTDETKELTTETVQEVVKEIKKPLIRRIK